MQIWPLLPSVSHSKTKDVMITADYSKTYCLRALRKVQVQTMLLFYIVMEKPTHKTETTYPQLICDLQL
jgi:hypothetical protein